MTLQKQNEVSILYKYHIFLISHILEDELFQENTITIVVSHDNEWNDYVDQIVKL